MSETDFLRDDAYHDLAANHVSAGRILALFKPYKRQILRVVILLLFGSAVGMASPFFAARYY